MNYTFEEIMAALGITLHQPYATLVAAGQKKLETRSWNARRGGEDYHGVVLIHASKFDYIPFMRAHGGLEIEVAEALDEAPGQLVNFICGSPTFPIGAILAVARIAHCVQHSGVIRRVSESVMLKDLADRTTLGTSHSRELQLTDREKYFGDYSAGRWAWYLTDVTVLPNPVPASGMQKLWKPKETVLRQVWEQLQLIGTPEGTPKERNDFNFLEAMSPLDRAREIARLAASSAQSSTVTSEQRDALRKAIGEVEAALTNAASGAISTMNEQVKEDIPEFRDLGNLFTLHEPLRYSVAISKGGSSRG